MRPLKAGELFEVVYPPSGIRIGHFKPGDIGIVGTGLQGVSKHRVNRSGGWCGVLINGRKTFAYTDEIKESS